MEKEELQEDSFSLGNEMKEERYWKGKKEKKQTMWEWDGIMGAYMGRMQKLERRV